MHTYCDVLLVHPIFLKKKFQSFVKENPAAFANRPRNILDIVLGFFIDNGSK